LDNPVGGENASEEGLDERCDFSRYCAAPEIHSGSKKVGKRSSDQCAVCGAGRPVAAEISHYAEPVVGVVFDLAAAAVSVEGL